jgi:hypothetical protein
MKRQTILPTVPISALIGGLLFAANGSALACATCGCTLSTDAATGFSTQAGWMVGLQYDYIDQGQWRHGTHSASTVPAGHELEKETTNHYVTANASYAFNSSWGINILLPYIIRDHSTYGNYYPGTLAELTDSHSSSIGDMKIIGNYQGFLPTHNLGVQVGVKLPTGRSGDSVHFNHGPEAGSPLDASLQPGTGSTDLILGAYYYQALSQDFDGFANLQFQTAVNSHYDYRPGNQANFTIGLRYMSLDSWVPQVQFNMSHRSHDQGASADVEDTEGKFIYFSPGISHALTRNTQVYAFMQVPVYRDLDGWQLAPGWTATVGFSYAFQH